MPDLDDTTLARLEGDAYLAMTRTPPDAIPTLVIQPHTLIDLIAAYRQKADALRESVERERVLREALARRDQVAEGSLLAQRIEADAAFIEAARAALERTP